jgi:hypothetical protein
MSGSTCVVLKGRVIGVRSRGREYARLSVRGMEGKKLLKYLGREVVVIVIIQQGVVGDG